MRKHLWNYLPFLILTFALGDYLIWKHLKNALPKPWEDSAAHQVVAKDYVSPPMKVDGGTRLVLTLALDGMERNGREAIIQKTIKVLARRMYEAGLKTAAINPLADGRLLVQIPSPFHSDDAVDLLTRKGLLRFSIVDDADPTKLLPTAGLPEGVEISPYRHTFKIKSEDAGKLLLRQLVSAAPAGEHFLLGRGYPGWQIYLVRDDAPVTSEDIKQVAVQFPKYVDPPYPEISIQFNQHGAQALEKLTRENVEHELAIVFDDFVDSAPRIKSAIPDGSARITLGRAEGGIAAETVEAERSVAMLKSGVLPVPVTVAEKASIPPSK